MEKRNVKKQLDNYMREFDDAVYHPILNRDIGEAKVEEKTVFFLLLPKLNGEEWTEHTNTAAIAVGAVYAAFEAHDRIDVESVSSATQQLTVLAGDYLSGVYYKLLAAIPDFDFIQILSTTIGQINEVKTDFHHQSSFELTRRIEAIKSIKANCVIQFLYAFGFAKYVPLATVTLPLMDLIATSEEKTHDEGGSHLKWRLSDQENEEAIALLKVELDQVLAESDFIDSFLKEEIREMTTPLLRRMI